MNIHRELSASGNMGRREFSNSYLSVILCNPDSAGKGRAQSSKWSDSAVAEGVNQRFGSLKF
jgi:hypothetical protein